jgi:membrane associated rhomboid family serine protease
LSLKAFHIVFVTASSLLSFVFAGWALHAHDAGDQGNYLLLGLLSAAFGVLLIVYGFWFWRKIRTQEEERRRRRKLMRPVPLVVLAALWALASSDASACSVCYGEADGPMIDAARTGVLVLFGMVIAMQLSFATFFICLWRRARRAVPAGAVSPIVATGNMGNMRKESSQP